MFHPDRCTRCGKCFTRCQYLNYGQSEAVRQINLLIAGQPSEVVERCATCAACNNYCPEGANPFDLILKRNEETDAMPYEKWMKNWFRPVSMMPSYIERGDPHKPALSLCVIESNLPRGIGGPMFEGMTRIKGGDYFCYMGYIHLGQKEIIGDLLRQSVANLAATGCQDIVFIHDECYAALHVMCKEFNIPVPFCYRHILHYMLEYLQAHRQQIRPLDLTVGMQIACSTQYAPELEDVVDEIFESIGVARPARQYERENALCCGMPISVRQKELAAQTRAINLDDVRRVGATAMVTLCPLCISGLVADAQTRELDVYMIHDLVRLALGETLPQPKFSPMDWQRMKTFLSHWRLFMLPYYVKGLLSRQERVLAIEYSMLLT